MPSILDSFIPVIGLFGIAFSSFSLSSISSIPMNISPISLVM
ncbi:MAG: hypothetical protein OWP43_09360 [Sphaerochaetaceae bacterium]|nr:hypothetical protein [Sphaerochaetaceae bacterium]